ncbi:MAG: hypothetical protein B7Y08_27090 [Rhodospirillales bacterium 24-66-33]|nr:MAG: hypothetical protein B7Y57_24800 [Rhodospirillales bacterium 35-66-84]OYZ91123.1 MAG: hypothetical protein B7Y08_27090 [Rhodospirillales bacterium 24-66-33]OZB22620.1 MAG: hypothetical protein B7X63_22140 [Rhodospirillales bacterium 39-66-50]
MYIEWRFPDSSSEFPRRGNGRAFAPGEPGQDHLLLLGPGNRPPTGHPLAFFIQISKYQYEEDRKRLDPWWRTRKLAKPDGSMYGSRELGVAAAKPEPKGQSCTCDAVISHGALAGAR